MRAKIGAEFHKLWGASAVSNLGDGLNLVAGPLLVATLTTDPVLVAGAGLVQQLPWLLLALVGGAVADRVNRQRLFIVVNLCRAAVLAALALSVATGTVTVLLLYAVLFLMGVGEVFADSASAGRLVAVVHPDLLPVANARLGATFTVINMWMAKPIGAWLFTMGAALPFGANAATMLLAALIVFWMRPYSVTPGDPKPLLREIREGVAWLWRHRALRTLNVTMAIMQVPFAAAFATQVLYATEHLGLSAFQYGLLLTAHALGALLGTACSPWLQARFRTSTLLRAGLLAETVTHLVLALTTSGWVAAATLTLFAVHAMVWGNVVATTWQRSVPDRLQGRVGGAYRLADMAGVALGTLLGGYLARWFGLAGPYWIAFAAMALIAIFAWRPVNLCDS
ncbi:MFS transporter [Nonomuraea sp. NPDC050663]|uniref:MFS transporter n=1 Tax=Nonomuraea sp. NPDC050663 TaxID=3364370 RepID=UPI0037AA855B